MKLGNLKIRTKLLASFIIVLVLTMVLGFIGYFQLMKNDGDYTNLIDNVMSRSQAMTDIGWSFARYRRVAATAILRVGDKATLDELWDTYQYEKNDISKQFVTFDEATKNDSTISDEERAAIKQVSDKIEFALRDDYEPDFEKIFEAAYAGDSDGATAYLDNMQNVAASLDQDISNFIAQAKEDAQRISDACTVSANASELTMIIIVIVIVVLGLAVALLISNSITKGVNNVTEAAQRVARGDFDVAVGSNDKDEIAILSNSLLELKTVIQRLTNDINRVAHNFTVGELDNLSIDASSYEGGYRSIADGVNGTVADLIDNCLYSIQFVSEIGNGNFDIDVKQFPGQRVIMTESFQTVKHNLIKFNDDIVSIINGAADGNLDVNIDTAAYKGGWNKMAGGINGLLAAIVKPIREAIGVLDQLSVGNLDVSVAGDYKGEFGAMKTALNNTLEMLSSYIKEIAAVLGNMANQDLTVSITRTYAGEFVNIQKAINNIVTVFNQLIQEINAAATHVSAGSKQIADSSMNLAQGTAEQASSVEELNATIEDVSSQTANNAKNADHVNKLADEAKETAEKGTKEMNAMLQAMNDINDSSANISKIIKVIDDIAFQTNLLALNAAVEAARAGEHGKGFAVVAEEVRNLAGRSQSAAKETSALIETSIEKVSDGSKIANETAKALEIIVAEINEISDVIGEVAQSSVRQSDSIGQINLGINQISEVTQNNSATSQEQASAAEELSSQADLFKAMVDKFRL